MTTVVLAVAKLDTGLDALIAAEGKTFAVVVAPGNRWSCECGHLCWSPLPDGSRLCPHLRVLHALLTTAQPEGGTP